MAGLIVIIAGLALNAAGCILLLKAGTKTAYEKSLGVMKVEMTNKNLHKWGLWILMIGFVIQMVGVLIG